MRDLEKRVEDIESKASNWDGGMLQLDALAAKLHRHIMRVTEEEWEAFRSRLTSIEDKFKQSVGVLGWQGNAHTKQIDEIRDRLAELEKPKQSAPAAKETEAAEAAERLHDDWCRSAGCEGVDAPKRPGWCSFRDALVATIAAAQGPTGGKL